MSNNLVIDKSFEQIIEKNTDLNKRDEKGRNSLFWAMYNRNYNLIKDLINLGINTQVTASLSAMNYAVYKDDVKLIKCLKNCGLDINEKDNVLTTPLIYAVLYNKIQSIDYLVSNGACIYHKDILGNSALTLAHDLKIQYLINKFEEIIILENKK